MSWPGAAWDRPVQGSREAGKVRGGGFEDFGISEIPLFPRADDHNFERLRRGGHHAGLQ